MIERSRVSSLGENLQKGLRSLENKSGKSEF